jgi:hypothetical protein
MRLIFGGTQMGEVILKGEIESGLNLLLTAEDANGWQLPGLLEALLHTCPCDGFQSLQVHPDFKRMVRKIAGEQFQEAYGAGYRNLEVWRRLFGADEDPGDERSAAGAEVVAFRTGRMTAPWHRPDSRRR